MRELGPAAALVLQLLRNGEGMRMGGASLATISRMTGLPLEDARTALAMLVGAGRVDAATWIVS